MVHFLDIYDEPGVHRQLLHQSNGNDSIFAAFDCIINKDSIYLRMASI